MKFHRKIIILLHHRYKCNQVLSRGFTIEIFRLVLICNSEFYAIPSWCCFVAFCAALNKTAFAPIRILKLDH